MFALSMTLMVMVEIKHSAPDSAAKSLASPSKIGGWGVPPILPLALLVEHSLHLDKPLPGEGKKGLLGHQLFFPKHKGLGWSHATLGGSQLNLLLSGRRGPRILSGGAQGPQKEKEKETRGRTPLIAGGKPSWPGGILNLSQSKV